MVCPLNRTNAPYVLRLFDYCFKQGVFDARDLEDDYTAREWLNERLTDGRYGVLFEGDELYDWKRWRFTLARWCRVGRIPSIGDGYLNQLQRFKSTSLFAVLPLAMRFYLMGVQEWLEYPNPNNTAIFQQTKKIHWKPMPKHLKKMSTSDFISYIQEFVYERQKLNLEEDLPPFRYSAFVDAMWRLTQKYPIDGPVRDLQEEEEEL